MKDLLETPELMPEALQAIFKRWQKRISNGLTYDGIAALQNEVEKEGYTFDYYLDAEPYGLRKIGTPIEQLEGYEYGDDENETF
jgi:hypothetical protein